MSVEGDSNILGPWNPGLTSQIPRALLPLSTMFRPENVTTSVDQATELSDFTGIVPYKLVIFRPQRLAVHEVLIRVTANLSVPDGARPADLGINFRAMTETLLSRYVEPHMAEIVNAYEQLRGQAKALAEVEIAALLAPPNAPDPKGQPRGVFARLAVALGGGRKPRTARPATERSEEREHRILAEWRSRAAAVEGPLERAVLSALVKTATAISGQRGRMVGDFDVLVGLVTGMVCNRYGSEAIGRLIEPILQEAATREGFRLLPAQDHPIVMNVKGASAAGKSTMRPLQRGLADRLGVDWAEFALISPDIWRKYLLDYESLGAAARYAGTLTGHELEVIDKKLDRYMAQKAERGAMSHLLIDRFRFDSFSTETERLQGSNLLTRFGDLIYMFFVITPPEATVERSWKRGLEVGRFKAVDDLLDHNVEAYTGMPRLFFTWALRTDKRVHCEFLDNGVPEGSPPRTVAFGWNGELNILSVKHLLDVDRYRKINVEATRPEDVYPDAGAMAPRNNTQFLEDCVRQLAAVNFVDCGTGAVYARTENGALVAIDRGGLDRAMADEDTRAGLEAIAGGSLNRFVRRPVEPRQLDRDGAQTLGLWGR